MLRIVLLVCMLSTTKAVSADHTESECHPGLAGCGFGSIYDTAVSASNRYNPVSIARDVEYLGAVMWDSRQRKFGYTVDRGARYEDEVRATIKIPKGFEIVAFWHTHGAGGYAGQYYSDQDTSIANTWRVPVYLADPTGRLRVFEPGDETLSIFEARKLGLGNGRGYAKGRMVRRNVGSKRGL